MTDDKKRSSVPPAAAIYILADDGFVHNGADTKLVPRAGFHDFGGATVGHPFEVLDEAGGQGVGLAGVVLTVRPGIGGIEDVRRNAGAFGGDVEAEDRVRLESDRIQFSGEGRVKQGARVPDADALADAEGAAGRSE